MPLKYVQVLHDDGRRYVAELLGQHRSAGRWRAVVRYTVAPGMRYIREHDSPSKRYAGLNPALVCGRSMRCWLAPTDS